MPLSGARWFQITIAAALIIVSVIACVRIHAQYRIPRVASEATIEVHRRALEPASRAPAAVAPPLRRYSNTRTEIFRRDAATPMFAPQEPSGPPAPPPAPPPPAPPPTTQRMERSSASSLGAPEACALHVFRHVSKAGGTTVRFFFDKLVTLGEWEYPLPYGASEAAWVEFVKTWRREARAYARGLRDAPKTLVEVRGHMPDNWSARHFLDRVLPDVEALRDEFRGSCSVTTSFLTRDPFSQYKSFYGYYIKKMQAKAVDFERLNEGGEAAFGANFAEWAVNVPDMQTRELLHDKCVPQMREGGYEVRPTMGEPTRIGKRWREGARGGDCDSITISDEDWTRVEDALSRFDVVSTMERFNEFMLVLGRVTGMKHLQYSHSNKGRETSDDGTMRPDVIANITTHDEALHAYADKAFDKLLVDLYGSVDAFKRDEYQPYVDATAQHNGKSFVGGIPEPSPYKWVKATDAEAQGLTPVQLPMWVMPNGGGQAWAYAGGDPVVMVRRDEAESLRCVKGCTFD